MTAPEVLAGLEAAKLALDGFLDAIKAVSPDFAKPTEDDLKAKIDAALGNLAELAADVPQAIADVKAVWDAGHGPTVGGADDTLA